MNLSLLITPRSTSPLREAGVFAGLTIALTWLFWLPGAFLPAALGNLLLAIGSFAPLAVAIFLQIWLQKKTLDPLEWSKTLSGRAVAVAVLIPLFILMPLILLRYNQNTLDVGRLLSAARGMWFSFVLLLILALAEEVGWRAYLLPRLRMLPLYATNLIVGFLWFVWQLPIVFAGRYNESENFGTFFLSMLLYSLLITPFLNRLARRANYNPILSAILRAGLQFSVAVYFLQGRADPLTDTFGILTIGWLLILNGVLFSQLWQGKKPPSEITELERIMPLEVS
jgi:hypothetical protein